MTNVNNLGLDNLVALRKRRSMNQSNYWALFGVTQSGGSRFEHGRSMPMSVAILLVLYESGLVPIDALREAAETARQQIELESVE